MSLTCVVQEKSFEVFLSIQLIFDYGNFLLVHPLISVVVDIKEETVKLIVVPIPTPTTTLYSFADTAAAAAFVAS